MVRVLVSTVVIEALAVQGAASAPVPCTAAALASSLLTTGPARVASCITPGMAPSSVTTHIAAVSGMTAHAGIMSSAADMNVMLRHCGLEGSRQHTCVAAPAEGLCFAGVGYDEISWEVKKDG